MLKKTKEKPPPKAEAKRETGHVSQMNVSTTTTTGPHLLRLQSPTPGTTVRLPAPTLTITTVQENNEPRSVKRRRQVLRRLDTCLSEQKFKAALSLLQNQHPHLFPAFASATATQVPRRLSALEKLEFDGNDLLPLRTLIDSVMESISSSSLPSEEEINNLDDEGHETNCEEDHFLCLQHEAGHFLVGYLLGALPKAYVIPSIEDFKHRNLARAYVKFVGFEFLREFGAEQMVKKNIRRGEAHHAENRSKISSKTRNNFSCITLGGLVAEHLQFGCAEGHHADVDKLKQVLKWLDFSENESAFQVRWAALSTIFILQNYQEARSILVKAMARGQSVGFCIDAIESAINEKEI